MIRASAHRLRFLSLICLFAGACADTGTEPPPPPPSVLPDMATPSMPLPSVADGIHSGERLKIAYYQSGATQYPGGLIDLAVGDVLVEPRLSADGRWRALPMFPDSPTGYYIDAGCSQPLYARETTATLPSLFTVQTPSGARVYALSGVAPPAAVYYGIGGSCMSRGLPGALMGMQLFTQGAEINLGTFAELVLTRGQ